MSATPHLSRPRATRAALALAAASALLWVLVLPPGHASAAVVHGQGFHATVDGDTGWFGSFALGSGLDATWCIDAERPAPDRDLAYQAIGLPGMSRPVRTALTWLLFRYAPNAGRVQAAAIALATHHLVGAPYPSGPLDLNRLRASDLSGFEGQEAQVLSRGRRFVRDALDHRRLRTPFRLVLTLPEMKPGVRGEAVARLLDGRGVGVEGAPLAFHVTGSHAESPLMARTGPDGSARLALRAVEGPNEAAAVATVPLPDLSAFGPTRGNGQRVIRSQQSFVSARARFEAHAPSTTTSTTTTTAPATTTTTTTTAPATTTTTTTTAPATTTTTTTTAPATTTTKPAPSSGTTSTTTSSLVPTPSGSVPSTTAAPAVPTAPSLPPTTTETASPTTVPSTLDVSPPTSRPTTRTLARTGLPLAGLSGVGGGLALLGAACASLASQRRRT